MRTFYYSLSLLMLMIGLNIPSAYALDCTMVYSQIIKCNKDSDCPGALASGLFCNINNRCPDPKNVCWYDVTLDKKHTKKSTKPSTK